MTPKVILHPIDSLATVAKARTQALSLARAYGAELHVVDVQRGAPRAVADARTTDCLAAIVRDAVEPLGADAPVVVAAVLHGTPVKVVSAYARAYHRPARARAVSLRAGLFRAEARRVITEHGVRVDRFNRALNQLVPDQARLQYDVEVETVSGLPHDAILRTARRRQCDLPFAISVAARPECCTRPSPR